MSGTVGARALLVAVSLSLVGWAGCASPSKPNEVQRQVTLADGEAFEANIALNGTDEIAYSWRTANGTTVAFDLHTHTPYGANYLRTEHAPNGSDTFSPPETGNYSLRWVNDGRTELTLTVEIDGNFTLRSLVGPGD